MGDFIAWLTCQKTFVVDLLHYWVFQMRFNASCHTESDREKMEYTLLRENHTIEKGLSLQHPRVGFGQQKVVHLLARLADYQRRYGQQNPTFLAYPLSTIAYWIRYTRQQKVEIPDIEQQFECLCKAAGMEGIQGKAGVEQASRDALLRSVGGNFADVLKSRHSVRYFSDALVSHDDIDKALQLAQLTPSACNRQGWKTHVYEGEHCHQLLAWQGGCRGFEQDVHQAIVVTANQKAFLYYEMFQAYVDGGLYAMNLINAFHSLGIGTIPLSLGFKQRKLKQLVGFGIPEHEVPVLIIGFGHLPSTYKVAVSERKPITATNTYHK